MLGLSSIKSETLTPLKQEASQGLKKNSDLMLKAPSHTSVNSITLISEESKMAPSNFELSDSDDGVVELIDSFAFNKMGGQVEKRDSSGSNLAIESSSSDSTKDSKKRCDIYLRTKGSTFKEYYFKLQGLELFFYKKDKDQHYDCLHSLQGAFVKEKEIEEVEIKEQTANVYPIKIVFSKKRARNVFFKSEEDRQKWKEEF